MTIILAKPFLCLALAVIVFAAVSGCKGCEEFETLLYGQLQDQGGTRDADMGNGRRLTLDSEQEALFLETVNAELERQKVRGAAYAFRGPVS
jgi:hypothetical protein